MYVVFGVIVMLVVCMFCYCFGVLFVKCLNIVVKCD